MNDSFDDLIAAFDKMQNDIDDEVDEVLKENAKEFSIETVASAKSVMNKGYWTGNLARMIKAAKTGNLQYEITSKAGYSGFLEYGTRYMEPETFMFPVYEKFTKKVRYDLQKLMDS
ncbi:HK97-gp10 family putative phage morphogenesis protein [Staphylococcus caeli]|uniref:HK97-gp10 family putative phage morphogenesis protein n=1 Tax=Staphylococcus caeli TaxID=2201815 RepID=UPI003F542DD8